MANHWQLEHMKMYRPSTNPQGKRFTLYDCNTFFFLFHRFIDRTSFKSSLRFNVLKCVSHISLLNACFRLVAFRCPRPMLSWLGFPPQIAVSHTTACGLWQGGVPVLRGSGVLLQLGRMGMLSCLQRLLSGRRWALISLQRQRLRSMTSSNFPSLWLCAVDGTPPPLTAGCPWASWASCWNCNCRWCCCWSCWSCCFSWSCCWWSWSCCCCRETLGLLGLQGCGRPCS